jgi:hypothetical protein
MEKQKEAGPKQPKKSGSVKSARQEVEEAGQGGDLELGTCGEHERTFEALCDQCKV